MDRETVLRRLVHLSTPVFLLYYLAPDPLWDGGITKIQGLLIAFFITMGFEALRLIFKFRIPGMRDYEYRRLSAAAWAALGMTIAFLFFPLEYAAPAFIGMGWVDPLIGELRKRKSRLYPLLPSVVYLSIVLISLSALLEPSVEVVIASLVATALGIGVERIRTRYVDDDFLMLVVPLIAIALILDFL